ncbi:macrophage migration inhibitory factor homolog [Clytia hemisphaerica]|uniref:L-dopachrome isomerase n=1 Tax=Clytia hemisphaerica TaxID=252671 RepID=A0A7M5X6M3_9CNID|eukprot:TCONS_00014100-protein
MPHLRIHTNLTKDLFTEEFIKNVTQKLATVFSLPPFAVLFSLSANETFYYVDSFDPAAFIVLGNLADAPDEEQNQQCAEIIFEAMKEVGVPQNRIDIAFNLYPKTCVAMDGKVFSKWKRYQQS